MGAVVHEMSLVQESTLRVDEILLGHWKVRISGPKVIARALMQVLGSLALPEDDLPPLQVTIAPEGRHATGSLHGSPLWSVDLPPNGWLSVLAGQVIASATTLFLHHLFIHAGAVGMDNRGLIIVGESGACKTSTVAALLCMGAVYFSDEVALLNPTTRTLQPFAIPMAIKPWTKKAAGNLPAGKDVAKEGRVQFLLPAHAAVGPVPVDAFVLLKPTRGHPQFASISRAEMLLNIATRSSSFGYRHRSEEAFAGFGRLLQTARCYVLESPSPASAIGRFQEALSDPTGKASLRLIK